MEMHTNNHPRTYYINIGIIKIEEYTLKSQKLKIHTLADETAYTLDTYPGHFLDTCDILH
jgi:hypothetical protein